MLRRMKKCAAAVALSVAALAMEMVITDPAYLTGAWTLRWLKHYTPGYEFIPVDCRVPPVYLARISHQGPR